MKKMTKRIVALLLASVMVMGLSITTFASTNTTHQVTIYFQSVTRDSSGAAGTASPLLGTSLSNSCVTVTVSHGASYKEAIIEACNTTNNNGVSAAVWEGSNNQYLKSLKVAGIVYENGGEYTGSNTYEGVSWMYFNNTPSDMPANINNYPDLLLEESVINADTSFTLSFETMVYTW